MSVTLSGGSWEQTIAILLEATEPVNGSWLQAIANALDNLPTPTGDGIISTIATNYTALAATTGATAGDFAYVENAQGSQWLPGSMGGTYYSAGLYYYIGGIWTNNLPPIENQLNIDTIAINNRLHLSGGTITGNLNVLGSLSATTYLGLPQDIYVTGFTYDNANKFTLANSTGGTLNAIINTVTGLTVNGGLVATTLTATTSLKYSGGVPSLGKVLTSDADGNATWQAPSTLGVYTFYFNDTPSDISTYYDAPTDVQIGTLSTISNAGVINNQLLATFASLPNYPNLTRVPSGNINLSIHAANTNSGKATTLYFNLYTRTTGGTETLIGTSSNSLVLPSINGGLTTDIPITGFTLNSSDRIITKIYASVTGGGGAAPDISLYLEDGTASRVSLPAEVVNTTNFVPYVGATSSVDLGAYNLISTAVNTNILTATTIHTTASTGNIFFSKNNTIGNNTSSRFKWDDGNFGLLIATSGITTGATYQLQSPVFVQVNDNDFYHYNIQNLSTGGSASSEYVLTANNGDRDNKFFAVGINNSGFNDATYSLKTPNSGYLLMNGGNLFIGTQTAHDIVFHTSGTTPTKETMRIKPSGSILINSFSGTIDNGSELQVSGSTTISNNLAVGVTGVTSSFAFVEFASTTKGVLLPRMTSTQRLAMSATTAGLKVYDTTLKLEMYYDGDIWLGQGMIKAINKTGVSQTGNQLMVWDLTTAFGVQRTTVADSVNIAGISVDPAADNAFMNLIQISRAQVFATGTIVIGNPLGSSTTLGACYNTISPSSGTFGYAMSARSGTGTSIIDVVIGSSVERF